MEASVKTEGTLASARPAALCAAPPQGSLAAAVLTRALRATHTLPVDVFHVLDIGTEGKIAGAPRVAAALWRARPRHALHWPHAARVAAQSRAWRC